MLDRVLWCLVVVSAAGCQTIRMSYPIPGTRAAIGEAALQSAQRLGWEAHLADSGQFLLVTTANGPMTIRPDENTLRFTVNRSEFGESALLAAAVENQLTGRHGERLSMRSGPLVVALGAVLPFTSTLYLGASDPVSASMGLTFGMMLASHIILDVVAVQMMWLSFSPFRSPVERWLFAGYAVSFAILNRIIAIVNGVRVVEQRNTWANSGVEVPTKPQLDRAAELRSVLW
jgi:hypothetical protein